MKEELFIIYTWSRLEQGQMIHVVYKLYHLPKYPMLSLQIICYC